MREKFEKLPEISRLIEKRNMIFNEEISRYGALGYADDLSLIDDIGFVSGAWYAFQEQQKKLDSIKLKLGIAYDKCDDSDVATLLYEIQELLK